MWHNPSVWLRAYPVVSIRSNVEAVHRWRNISLRSLTLAFALVALSVAALPSAAPAATMAGQSVGFLSQAPLQSLAGGVLPPGGGGGTPYVDGISDQSLPAWDGSFADGWFAGLFRDAWVATWAGDPSGGLPAHITLARYVVQWNITSGAYPGYLSELRYWYADALSLGLAPEVALASYDGALPASAATYGARLTQLLDGFPAIRYIEAWNEPNDTPGLSPATAARYTAIAHALCLSRGCVVIAGDLLDSPNMLAYEAAYARALGPVAFIAWGIHPYHAVKARSPATVLAFRAGLPRAGAGARIWFTEVGAYRCEGGAHPELLGERAQALDASWLVNRLMPAIQPVHVFYYELLFRDRLPPPCDRSDSDTALYAPAGGTGAYDVPRAAASYIYDDHGPLAVSVAGERAAYDVALASATPAPPAAVP